MIFSSGSIEAILAGRKTMTRRLVKEGEELFLLVSGEDYVGKVKGIYNKVKWQVGKQYAVCPGRGKRQVGTCDCGKIVDVFEKRCHAGWKPLWITITGLRHQNLLDISEEEARAEGFKPTHFSAKQNFLNKFCEINFPKLKEDYVIPDVKVWVIEFKVGL